jgi:hypothetical protein
MTTPRFQVIRRIKTRMGSEHVHVVSANQVPDGFDSEDSAWAWVKRCRLAMVEVELVAG